jgi:hypothetical protein
MNEYFKEYTRKQNLVPDTNRDDPRYTKNADAFYQPPPAGEVLRALCTYPGIDGWMFDDALITTDLELGEVAVELDDLVHTTYIFGRIN